MAVIYTETWYELVKSAINAHVGKLPAKVVPEGSWHAVIEIVGDGESPYVDVQSTRRFLVRIDGGRCAWYREIDTARPDDVELDYRFTGPASVFDAIAAGLMDPIDAALDGTIRVRGDMRFLMRQAELVKTLLEAYTTSVDTEWPEGRPPYNGAGGGLGNAAGSGANRA